MTTPATRPASSSRLAGRPRDARITAAILESTRRQLAEIGYARLSVEGVAVAAGVSRATVYRRFRDKADLVTAALADAHVPWPSPDHVSPRAELISQLVEFDRRFGDQGFAMLGALVSDRDEPRALALHRARTVHPRTAEMTDVLRRAQAAGDLDASADLDLAAEMLAGAVFTRRVTGRPAEPGWAERAVATVWRGMAPGVGPTT